MTDYETEIRERTQGLALCAGCEEEYVKLPEGAAAGDGPVYCGFCESVRRALEMDYKQITEEKIAVAAPRVWDKLPRVEMGTVPIGQLMRPVETVRKPALGRRVVLVAQALGYLRAVLFALYLLARWFLEVAR